MSPYPTVVIVIIAHHIPSGMDFHMITVTWFLVLTGSKWKINVPKPIDAMMKSKTRNMKSRVDLAKVRTITRNESLYRVSLARRIRRNILGFCLASRL